MTGWYPYPFLNADKLGHTAALRNTIFVLVFAAILGLIFKALDRWLPAELSIHKQSAKFRDKSQPVAQSSAWRTVAFVVAFLSASAPPRVPHPFHSRIVKWVGQQPAISFVTEHGFSASCEAVPKQAQKSPGFSP